MKLFKIILKVFLFIIGFLLATWIFMPWRQVGEAVMSTAVKRMAAAKTPISYSTVDAVKGGFEVNDIAVGGFMKYSFRSVTLRPQALASLFSLSPTCYITFKDGKMLFTPPVQFGDGSFTASVSPSEIFLEDLRTNGEMAINGFVGINPAQMRISRAEASVKVPETFDQNMESLKAMLPLVKETAGRWHLRRALAKPQQGEAPKK